jgi:hypothetical protein
VKRTAIAVSMCFGMAPSVAFAVDWSIRATESETVELNSNQFLRNSPAGSIGSYSTLSANAQALTPTSKFDFDADGSYKKYWGPGVDGSTTEYLNYGFKGRYEIREKLSPDKEYIEGSWRQQSTALALLNDLGVSTPVHGFLDTVRASGGLDRTLSARDTLNLYASSTHTSYEPSGGGTPFTDTLTRGVWRHRISPIAAVTVTSEGEFLQYGNALNTNIQIYRDQAGVDATLSQLLSFRGNVGAAYVVTNNGAGTPVFGGGSVSGSSAVSDWIGDAVLTYRVLKNTTLTLTASHSIGPSVVGSLFKRDSISAGLAQTINDHSSLSFSLSANRQISSTTTDYASASATYSYNFTREWSSQLTYRYLHRFASSGGSIFDPVTGTPTVTGTGPADSHSIMVVVSHTSTLLPRGN